jgi:hypothetical protein
MNPQPNRVGPLSESEALVRVPLSEYTGVRLASRSGLARAAGPGTPPAADAAVHFRPLCHAGPVSSIGWEGGVGGFAPRARITAAT